jgi:hypothetical protein
VCVCGGDSTSTFLDLSFDRRVRLPTYKPTPTPVGPSLVRCRPSPFLPLPPTPRERRQTYRLDVTTNICYSRGRIFPVLTITTKNSERISVLATFPAIPRPFGSVLLTFPCFSGQISSFLVPISRLPPLVPTLDSAHLADALERSSYLLVVFWSATRSFSCLPSFLSSDWQRARRGQRKCHSCSTPRHQPLRPAILYR